MNLRPRDRIALVALVVLALAGVYYMLALKPERQKVKTLNAEIATQQQAIAQAQQQVATGQAAVASLRASEAQWAAVSLAVPARADIPALLRLLERTTDAERVSIQSITLSGSSSGATGASSGTTSGTSSTGSASSNGAARRPVPVQLSFTGSFGALDGLIQRLEGLVDRFRRPGARHRSADEHQQRPAQRIAESERSDQREHLPAPRLVGFGRHGNDHRRAMNALRRDLFERRLWPLVALLIAAVVAVPVLALKHPSASGAATATPPHVSLPGLPTTTTAATNDAPTSVKGAPRDPFASSTPKLASQPPAPLATTTSAPASTAASTVASATTATPTPTTATSATTSPTPTAATTTTATVTERRATTRRAPRPPAARPTQLTRSPRAARNRGRSTPSTSASAPTRTRRSAQTSSA